jgi:predicted permease
MMLLEAVKITLSGVGQIFLLGAIGYSLVKRNILSREGLDSLSRIVIDVILPLLIFCQLVKDFSFTLYPDWWLFPLLSIAITVAGTAIGYVFAALVRGEEHKRQFISLVAFQNSGYLPLALIGSLLAPDKLGVMFIYLFLFLAGFNLLMFSFGAELICYHKLRKFEIINLFSPPVLATIIGLITVYFGWNKVIPEAVLKPLRLVGDCTLPLAMFVVGANLAEIRLTHVNKKEMLLMLLAKLFILPAAGLILVLKLNLPELVGLLIIMQLAVPSATLLSVLTRHYKKEDLLVSQGIFFGHLASIITIPVFLSLYFYFKALP